MIKTAYLTPAIFAIKKYFCAMAFQPFSGYSKGNGADCLKGCQKPEKA